MATEKSISNKNFMHFADEKRNGEPRSPMSAPGKALGEDDSATVESAYFEVIQIKKGLRII